MVPRYVAASSCTALSSADEGLVHDHVELGVPCHGGSVPAPMSTSESSGARGEPRVSVLASSLKRWSDAKGEHHGHGT